MRVRVCPHDCQAHIEEPTTSFAVAKPKSESTVSLHGQGGRRHFGHPLFQRLPDDPARQVAHAARTDGHASRVVPACDRSFETGCRIAVRVSEPVAEGTTQRASMRRGVLGKQQTSIKSSIKWGSGRASTVSGQPRLRHQPVSNGDQERPSHRVQTCIRQVALSKIPLRTGRLILIDRHDLSGHFSGHFHLILPFDTG